MAEHKKQHYLAAGYLKGFANIYELRKPEHRFNIWVYDIQKKTIKFRPPESVAWRSYYYSSVAEDGNRNHSLELDFSKLENEVIPLFREIDSYIDKLRRGRQIIPLTDNDRQLLVYFIFWHMKKVPATMDIVRSEMQSMLKEVSLKFGGSFTESEVNNRTLDLINEIGNSNESSFYNVLVTKNFRLAFPSNTESSFITTDNPVVRFNPSGPDGIGVDETEIYFPISQHCLAFLHQIGNRFEYFEVINRKIITELNTYIASKAKHLIISRDRAYLMAILDRLKYPIISECAA